MAVLVTGGTGYIGSHAVVELLLSGERVVIVDNLSTSKAAVIERVSKITGKRPVFYKCDLNDRVMLDKIFCENPDVDSVVHFAGLKAVGESVEKPLLYYKNNVCGTLNLLEAMLLRGVKRMVFSSSATVYGNPASVPIKENFPLCATNPYGETKIAIENIIRATAKANPDFSACILRYFNPIGAHESGLIGEDPRGTPNNLLPYIAKVAAGKLEVLNVFGSDYETRDGTGVRDYIHVVDLAKAHISALEYTKRNTGAEAINVGTGKGYTVLEIVEAFGKAWGAPIKYKISSRRKGDIAECYADISLAKEKLSWHAELGLNKMCEDSARFQKMNPDGYPE